MNEVTIGQIAAAVAMIATLISGLAVISSSLKKYLKNAFDDHSKAIVESLSKLEKRVEDVDREACKNYLVIFLSGVDKGNAIDEIEKERFWEEYEHYKKTGGNSYIKRKVEALVAEGKL